MPGFPYTKCFLIVPTGKVRRSLRRYRASSDKCPQHEKGFSFCNAHSPLDVIEWEQGICNGLRPGETMPDRSLFPTNCEACGRAFLPEDRFQVFDNRLYRSADTGEEITLSDAKPGAMYDADWLSGIPEYGGPDGKCLHVILPNGRPWHIDGRASNCTLPNDKAHRCWVRHGEPPMISVDKNGLTCAAGGGSIASGEGANHYHGFLRQGFLTAG